MQTLRVAAAGRELSVIDLPGLLGEPIRALPYSLRLLSENHIRNGGSVAELREALANRQSTRFEFSFRPNRILMHDTTCTPALADIAGLRDAIAEIGGDPNVLSPTLPVDVSVDHSLAVDAFGVKDAFARNLQAEYERNSERYAFMKWASLVMDGVRVHPPGTGIMHTINLEQLSTVLAIDKDGFAHPDMMLGTDSHTPMVSGVGVLGWGVGGLEAECVMFGQSVSLSMPKVVGVRLTGKLPSGTFATDLALEVTNRLRALDVTGAFVEFFGPGVTTLSADARAVVANMAPEYGATTGFFPVDQSTVSYLERTGRPHALCQSIEPVFRAMDVWFDASASPTFDDVIEINLSKITPVIAGPRRPQDRCDPADAAQRIEKAIGRDLGDGVTLDPDDVPDGAVGIAAITSCTNTSDPSLVIAAGLLARAANARGLRPKPWVKTSLAPGSPSTRDLLRRAGLEADLSALGFDVVGFGCTTCIGNSGPLPAAIETALAEGKAVAAVLSGNRNFPGRVHPKLDLGYLASPPLVVAYALLGHIRADILTTSLGVGEDGRDVFLADIWPSAPEISAMLASAHQSEDVSKAFAQASHSESWENVPAPATPQFPWDPASRTLRRPKFTYDLQEPERGPIAYRPLMVLGDDITTDHISPAGAIEAESAAGQWLIAQGADRNNLNVYAAYRGNWEVMLRGLFTNRMVRNYLGPDLAPAETNTPDGRKMPVFEAAEELSRRGEAGIIFAGERYGMGSSRDWAAKGLALLGVKAVVAKSFERIHRTNLIGMGILPLQIEDGSNPSSLGVSSRDRIEIDMSNDRYAPGALATLTLAKEAGETARLKCRMALETEQDVRMLDTGGAVRAIFEQFRLRMSGDD